jgi:probable F420-dependent oxidoreductase
MDFGAAMFFTDYSMKPAELGQALEARGFESVWAPEHSHIPSSRLTPPAGGGQLGKQYYDVMDPFVTLTAAAMATKSLKVATGVCLVIQRDTIQTAKLVATIDQVSDGRFLFGIGGGWNQDEIESHGAVFKTRFKKMREQIEAMTEIWSKSEPEYHGEIVNVPKMRTWPKPVQKPRPPVIVGGAFRIARGARYVMATAGSRMRAGRHIRTSPNFCRSSGRWQTRPAAIRRLCRSRFSGRPKAPTG